MDVAVLNGTGWSIYVGVPFIRMSSNIGYETVIFRDYVVNSNVICVNIHLMQI